MFASQTCSKPTGTVPATLGDLHELIAAHEAAPTHTGLPVHPGLSQAFPAGLRAGHVYSVTGSIGVALAMLAGASRRGSWCAAVGLPDLGVEAATECGIDLDRLILVPRPGEHWCQILTELAEITDAILTAPARLHPGDVQRLQARLRTRRTSVIVLGPWPRAMTVQARTLGWDGIGQGHGCILRRRLQLDITERHRNRRVQLDLPVAA